VSTSNISLVKGASHRKRDVTASPHRKSSHANKQQHGRYAITVNRKLPSSWQRQYGGTNNNMAAL